MTEALVLLDVEGDIATLTFNDGARMNPLTLELLGAALDALARVGADTSIRALILKAHGKGFCTGADLSAFKAPPQGRTLGEVVDELMADGGNPLVLALRSMPVPVVCAVQGAAAGGGVGIALAADIVIAGRSAFFLLPFVPSLGLVPDMGAAWFMPPAIGTPRARALMLLGDRLGAEQAAQWGLIWSCVDDDQLEAETLVIAKRLTALPTHGVRETRALLACAASSSLPQQLDYERDRQRTLIERDSFAEGVAAFTGRRRPLFRGRDE